MNYDCKFVWKPNYPGYRISSTVAKLAKLANSHIIVSLTLWLKLWSTAVWSTHWAVQQLIMDQHIYTSTKINVGILSWLIKMISGKLIFNRNINEGKWVSGWEHGPGPGYTALALCLNISGWGQCQIRQIFEITHRTAHSSCCLPAWHNR